jgi:hypothetical protein
MSKRELIDEILRLNPTAKPDFLSHFKEKDLQEYLDHLNWLNTPATELVRRPAARAVQECPEPAESNVAVAVADANSETAEACDDTRPEESLAEAPAFEERVATSEVVAVAASDESDEPLPFADQSQEDTQTYLF